MRSTKSTEIADARRVLASLDGLSWLDSAQPPVDCKHCGAWLDGSISYLRRDDATLGEVESSDDGWHWKCDGNCGNCGLTATREAAKRALIEHVQGSS
jgi:hypothetical protein